MKNKIMITATIIAVTLNLVNCNPKELIDPLAFAPNYVVIDGDTVKTRNDAGKVKSKKSYGSFEDRYFVTGDTFMVYKNFYMPKPNKVANLYNIKNNVDITLKGKPLRLVAIGGAVTAGMRDGGLFNEGMITSYPNIIANQMGIKYDLPLFDSQDYNGFGRKVLTNFNPTGGPMPKLKKIENNTGIESVSINEFNVEQVKLKQFRGSTDSYINIYPMAYNNFLNVMQDPLSPEIIKDLKKGKKFDFFILDCNIDGFNNPGGGTNIITDLVISELGLRDFKKYPEDGIEVPIRNGINFPTRSNDNDYLIKHLFDKKLVKGVLINVPFKNYLGYYQKNYIDDVIKKLDLYQIDGLYSSKVGLYDFPTIDKNELKRNQNTHAIYGSSGIDSLISPNVNVNLKKGLSFKNPIFPVIYFEKKLGFSETLANNESIKIYAEYLKVPIFDLNGLYKSVFEGTYVTIDGIKVNGKWPEGNFFSSDGIHPSAFGQAIIANEIIKTINSFYKTDIPPTTTREFLNR
jgi:hypothetical protein